MNPLQNTQTSSANPSAEDQRLLALYGTQPNKRRLLQDQLKERKFFDSGDYALSKAGKTSDTGVSLQTGKTHPRLKNISQLSSPVPRDSNVAQKLSRERTKSISLSPVEAKDVFSGGLNDQGQGSPTREEEGAGGSVGEKEMDGGGSNVRP